MSIFREYDIRGVIGKDLTEETILNIGKAFGSIVQGKVLVGRDNRLHGNEVKDIFIQGLLSTGCDVVDLGIITSPMLYFASKKLENSAAVMVTASHNPKEFNGFKIIKDNKPFFGEDIYKLGQLVESKVFKSGEGTLSTRSITEAYHEFFNTLPKLNRQLNVVVDCGNGTASLFYPEILKSLGCNVTELYCTSDGNFPNHEPDPVVESNLKDLISKVKELKADIGLGFDGDGDRLGVVDETGKIIPGDKTLILLARDLLSKHPNEKVIYEVKCSMLLESDIRSNSGIPIMYKTGHSLIKAKMKEENAALAGEMSGHFFFRELNFFDDAMYAAYKVLTILSNSNQTLSSMLSDLPKTYATPEIRDECPDNLKKKVILELLERFKKYNPLTIDGLRINFEDGWGLVRQSNTQPVLVLRFEATSPERLQEIQDLIMNEVNDVKSRALAENKES
ncbi:phosphomannomutase/phosphoglucomutase [Candidatus Woesearchaeota archaeon]|nr:MAG: phosphomannomutase/phosphoglucomutase [Candidatus Woesearchaeota archaeon]